MAKQSVLSNVQSFQFKGIALMGNLTEWSDTRQPTLAVHRTLKRDGGTVEYMGREPHRFRGSLVFLGANWRTDFNNLLSSVDDDPTGLLVHPTLGQMQCACEGVTDARVVPGQMIDTYTVPISFIENNVDQKLSRLAAQGVGTKQQQVTADTSALTTATASLPSSSVAVGSLVSEANAYASAAGTSAFSATPDPSLPTRLAAVATNASAAIAAIEADTAATTDASKYDAIQLATQVYASCLQLADAVAAQQPPMINYTVPGTTNVLALAALFYGTDAPNRVGEILANNRIPKPYAIPPGTVLLMASPTV